MIKRMIKPGDAAPSATQTTATTVERAPDISSGDDWWPLRGLPRRGTTPDRLCGRLSEISLRSMCAKAAERWPRGQ
jgi:hypothetical protein